MKTYTALIVSLLGAFKMVLSTLLGIEIPDATIEDLANGLSAILVIVGILMNTRPNKNKKDE